MCFKNELCESAKIERIRKTDLNCTALTVSKKPKSDILAQFTYQTKLILSQLNVVLGQARSWKYYKMMSDKTQPAHVITILSVIFISAMIRQSEARNESKYLSASSDLMKLIYLGCFAAHIGAQVWMTFVSGLSLYFALPRHTFGSVQIVLFPKYFSVNCVFSLGTLFGFINCRTIESTDNRFQMTSLILCFMIELTIRLYITPVLVQLMLTKTSIEEEAGVGTEVGEYLPGYLTNCPNYVTLHAKFRKVHMAIAMGNMVSMACTFAHLFYLSSRMCI